MAKNKRKVSPHPTGEQPLVEVAPPPAGVTVESWAGPVRIEWDVTAPLTPFGQLPFFIEFLKVSGLFDAWVADCPLTRTSPNAPSNRDVLGTLLLSVLAGHKRYAHITALRADTVLAELIGMSRVMSEDAVRRALQAIEEEPGAAWLRSHLDYCVAPLRPCGAWLRHDASRGFSTSIPPSSRCTGTRRARSSATIRRSRADPATPTTPT